MTDDEIEKVADVIRVGRQAAVNSHDIAADAITALQQLGWQRVQEGWRLVPVEPTEGMLKAGYYANAIKDWSTGEYHHIGAQEAYRAMLAASPSAPAPLSPASDARPVSQETT